MNVIDRVAACRDALQRGQVVLVPTDTVYGIAAALDDEDAVQALYTLKGRPRSQPCQVLCFAPVALDPLLTPLDSTTAAIVRDLLPGSTTCIVADPAGRCAAAAGASVGSVGLRFPAMDEAFQTIDIPLIATSANDPGGRDPRRVADVPNMLRAGLGAIVDAGELPGTPSAVVDLRTPGAALIVRPGHNPAALADRLAAHGVVVTSPA